MTLEVAHRVQVTTKLLQGDPHEARFKVPEDAPLLEVLQQGAEHAHVELLPNSEEPLDRLHNFQKHHQVGPAIDDLEQTVHDFLKEHETTRDFGIELVLAFRVNARWAVAPESSMTPRQILSLPAINLDFQAYSLYLPKSADLLPLDTPITITRGLALEAQRDGKYGAR